MNRLLVLLVAFLASAVAFVPPMTARSLSAVAAPVTRSHVEMGRGDKRTAKGAPLRSSLGRRAPAWGTRLRSRSSQRPREACGTVHAGARPQVCAGLASRGEGGS